MRVDVCKLLYRYNKYIKRKGKKFYALLLLITTILQSTALSIIPSIFDKKWDNTICLFFIMFIIFSLVNSYRYTKFNSL